MFDQLCPSGGARSKILNAVLVLGSLALHVWDITSDILVAIRLYDENLVWFGMSIGIMVLGSLMVSFVSAMSGTFAQRLDGNDDPKGDGSDPGCCAMLGGCCCGLLQLSIFVDAYDSIRLNKRTDGYAMMRIFEAMCESAPQSLLQLYIVLTRAKTAMIGNTDVRLASNVTLNVTSNVTPTINDPSDDILIYISIGTSIVSLASGVVSFHKYTAKNDKIITPYISSFFVTDALYVFFMIASRMSLLACVGVVFGIGGWTIGIVLLVDYVVNVVAFVRNYDDDGVGSALFRAIIFCIPFMACNFWGFFFVDGFIFPQIYLIKSVEGLFMVGGIGWYIVRGMNISTPFIIFSSIGTASFVLAYILRYLLLKWAHHQDNEYYGPRDVYLYCCCSQTDSGSTGGLMSERGYERRKNMTKVAPGRS